jgi:hypothetical protein
MQREQIIEALVVDCLVSIFDRNQYCWLQGILENGFRGFAQMTTEELQMEMRHRNLDIGTHHDGDVDFEIDDCTIGHRDLPAMNDRHYLDEV